ncbi:MAG: hypothetical protein PSX36_01440 [bacterium]|nr:hypothetical protein [bacterium]
MKKVNLGFALLTVAAVFVLGCKKPTANVEPVADTETQSAIDAAWATYVISDIDQVCGFIGENNFLSHFYVNVPGTQTVTGIRDIDNKNLVMGWNKTMCVDGRLRDGSIFMGYKLDSISNPNTNLNSVYYREYGFVGRITFSEYKIDGWRVTLFDPAAPAYVYNKITTPQYDPSKVKLTWSIEGKFLLEHPSDPSRNIVWSGKLFKTLTNSTDPKIFAVTKQSAINWASPDPKLPRAIVSYHTVKGNVITGMTNGNVPFSMTIDEKTPLIRDFKCFPDQIAGVVPTNTPGVVTVMSEEHHPFISGIASFTTGTSYPRQVYFGNEGNPDIPGQCDITGTVLIKGNSYPINFRK